MKAHVAVMLAAALGIQLGDALLCYYCPVRTPIAECSNTKNCSTSEEWCMTRVYADQFEYAGQGELDVIKDCSTECKNSEDVGTKHPEYCCNADLCNARGLNNTADGVTSEFSYTILTTFAGLISVLH